MLKHRRHIMHDASFELYITIVSMRFQHITQIAFDQELHIPLT